MKKILLSGVKPTGKPHIGNYFGAMRQFIDLQEQYQTFIFIADYHALNFIKDAKEMRENITSVLIDYLAIGLNTERVTIFKQSDVSEHTELCWIFDTITTMPYLQRGHAYKDALAKNKEVEVGTFNYPMLMAADILLYDADIVPVGLDQKQHIEYARDTAEKFNRVFNCNTFKLPDALIMEEVSTVPGIDGRKMSKSYGNDIGLFAEFHEIKEKVMSIVTDSGDGIPKNVFAIHKLLRPENELNAIYNENKGKYKILKELLIEDLEKFIAPLREKRKKIANDIPLALEILKEGGKRAKEISSKKMSEVRQKIGVNIC